ncbi:unnamed protein product [Plutella xylostella]|uniref:(diamondback moth) hypothetical protein n=1 Tax=Plutella xylostella TaxID=51655 RepID=A0A8S4DLX8_PLUXY|nr:unnamed protein product [Plutella xylostella]
MVQTSEKKKELQQWETSHPASLQARVFFFKCGIYKGKHNTLLHNSQPAAAAATNHVSLMSNIQSEVLLPTISVKLQAKNACRCFSEPRNIDILLGCDIMFQILLRERLPVIPGQLFLHNTQFGYIVAGTAPLNSEGCSSLPSNFCNFPIFSGIPPLPPGHASIMRRSPG